MTDQVRRKALISVYNKEGIANFASELAALGWDILASGGTAKVLKEAGIAVQDVAEFVGEPILGHRVVTLSRQIHAALLSRDNEEDKRELERIGMPQIDLVCVDLYPLEKTINAGATEQEVIKNTDLGGVALLRSAAKGRRIVISHPDDREKVLQWLKDEEPRSANFRRWLAGKAELAVSDYCRVSARYLLSRSD